MVEHTSEKGPMMDDMQINDETLETIAGGEGILDELDPVLLELLRTRPQF